MEKNVEVRHHRREALRSMGNGKMCRGFTRGAVDDQPEDPYMHHGKIFFFCLYPPYRLQKEPEKRADPPQCTDRGS